MAEGVGFAPLAALAITPGRENASKGRIFFLLPFESYFKMAEGVGFEPTAPCGVTGFQDRLLKPLGHPSMT